MGKQWKQWLTLFFWAPKITADGDCSHEIKRRLLLGRNVTNTLAWKIPWMDPPLHLGILPLVYLCTLQGWGEGLVFRMDSSSFLLVAVGEVTPHLSCLASWSAGQPLTLLSPSTAQQREGCDSPPRPEAPCRGTIPSRLTCCALTCSRVDICPPSFHFLGFFLVEKS